MFTKGQWITLVVIAVAIMLLGTGCNAQSPAAASTAPFPTGTRFRATHLHWGEFFSEFQADGTLVLTRSGDVTIRGTFAVSGNQLKVKGILCDAPDKESGTYSWNFDGKTLILSSSDDKCSDRWQVMTQVWTKT